MTLRHLKGACVLIAEDNMMIGLDVTLTLEESEAVVLGPVARVSEALELAASTHVDGAILDVDLLDGIVTPLAEALIANGVPVVFCTGVGLPADLRSKTPDAPVFSKPTEPERLARMLSRMIREKASGPT